MKKAIILILSFFLLSNTTNCELASDRVMIDGMIFENIDAYIEWTRDNPSYIPSLGDNEILDYYDFSDFDINYIPPNTQTKNNNLIYIYAGVVTLILIVSVISNFIILGRKD